MLLEIQYLDNLINTYILDSWFHLLNNSSCIAYKNRLSCLNWAATIDMNSCPDDRTLIELSLYDFVIFFFFFQNQFSTDCLLFGFCENNCIKRFYFWFKIEKYVFTIVHFSIIGKDLQRNLIIGVISNRQFSRERERESNRY